MRKVTVLLCAIMILMAITPAVCMAKVDRQPGGIPAFIVGCCWGIREGSEWNEGADMHWREWVRIVPVVSLIVGIWDGVECYKGMTAHQWAEANGANWY